MAISMMPMYFMMGSDSLFFDWGDASITHPFITLMIPMRVLGNFLGVEDELNPKLDWARDAYLQSWMSYALLSDLQKVWELALHIGKFQHSLIYCVIIQLVETDAVVEYRDSFPNWLKEFIYYERARDD